MNLPYQPQDSTPANTPYHIVPDNRQGGWNVYATHKPQEPQVHFDSKEEAISYCEQLIKVEGTAFTVEQFEAPSVGEMNQ